MPTHDSLSPFDSVSHHTIVDTLVIGPKIVFIDSANDAELIIDILERCDAITHMDASLQLLIDYIVSLHPSVRLLVVDIF